MPGKVKVKIIAGKNLPVMDRSGDTTDAYVEIKLGNTTYKTDVCRKSLNPQWNSDWYRFEVDDSELQDEPLQLRLMDHDTYSANDAIGKVYLSLNPLLLPYGNFLPKLGCGIESNNTNEHVTNSIMTGWIPVYDTMHGIRGEVNVMVKVELFSDFNRFRQSSCGVQFFCSQVIPNGYCLQMFHGFVEELIVNDDPEYQWIDKIRTPRASNEARQTLFFKLAGELQRKIGLKALELGGNSVVGYNICFDLEGESGVVVRGTGTAVTLVKLRPPPPVNTMDVVSTSTEEQALSYLQFIGCNSSFHLNPNVLKNPSPTASPFLDKSHSKTMSDTVVESNLKQKKIFTRHLSYTDFSKSVKSAHPLLCLDNIQHASSLQTLLQQEDMRGNPGTGITQRIKNFKYSSQNMLAKKMTALKAKLVDSEMIEEVDDYGFRSISPIVNLLSEKTVKKKNLLQKSTTTDSSVMAQMLVHSLMNTTLDCISETYDHSESSLDMQSNVGLRGKIIDSIDMSNKSMAEAHLEPTYLSNSLSNVDTSESSSSDGDDSDGPDDNIELDTVSNIVKNVEKSNKYSFSDDSTQDFFVLNDEFGTSPNLEYEKYNNAPLAQFESFDIVDADINCSSTRPCVQVGKNENKEIVKISENIDNTCSGDSLETRSVVSNNPNSPISKIPFLTSNNNVETDLKFNTSTQNTNLTKILSPNLSVNPEFDKGNNNMHASLAHSLRTIGSPNLDIFRSNDQRHHRTESVGAKISHSPARYQPIPYIHRRSSDSDLSVTPKGNSLTGSDKSNGLPTRYFSRVGALLRSAVPQEHFDMLEYPFITLSKYPPGFIIYLGGVVSARSVKLLERITNLEEPEGRDMWWTELRMEIRSHARSIGCNAVLAYRETSSICDDICVLSASGTAAVIGYQYTADNIDNIGLAFKTKTNYCNKDPMASSLDRSDFEREKSVYKPSDNVSIANTGLNAKPLPESPENEPQTPYSPCTVCHLPYAGNSVPLHIITLKCGVCRSGRVPDILLATIEIPEGIPSVGRGCFIQAHVCRPLKDVRSELGAKDISDGLPFLEYELHRILVNKIKIKGMNAIFALKVKIAIGVKMLVGIATGTGVYLLSLPPSTAPKLVSDHSTDEKKLAEMQKLLTATVRINKDIYQLKVNEEAQTGRLSPDNDSFDSGQQLIDLAVESRDCCVLEVDDPDDMELMNLLMEPRPPDGFHVVNTEVVPGLEEMEIVKNLQMFIQIWRAKLQPPYNLGRNIHKLLQSVYFKLRRMIPCAVCDLQFQIDLPESDEIQLTVLDEDLIFKLEDDNEENRTTSCPTESNLCNVPQLKFRGKSPLRSKGSILRQLMQRERYGVDISPLSYIPGGNIERYLGNLNFFFIRETTSIREEGGLSGFIHSFLTEVLAIVRAHIAALGGNAMVGYYITKCVLSHSVHKNQGQCLINVGGDVVFVSYIAEE